MEPAATLERLKGLRVEWEDGAVGEVEGVALVVRTAGLGSARPGLELVSLDDVAEILPAEGRIVARAQVAAAPALAGVLRRVLRRREPRP